MLERFSSFNRKRLVASSKYARGIKVIHQEVAGDPLIHRCAHAEIRMGSVGKDEGIFWTGAWAAHQHAGCWIFHQVVKKESNRTVKRRPCAVA